MHELTQLQSNAKWDAICCLVFALCILLACLVLCCVLSCRHLSSVFVWSSKKKSATTETTATKKADTDSEATAKLERLRAEARSWLPFSAGRRDCVGQRFAMHEGTLILARMVSPGHRRWHW